jgi:hypothetical protein
MNPEFLPFDRLISPSIHGFSGMVKNHVQFISWE